MKLIIAEKPSLARNIVAGIGKMDRKDGYFEFRSCGTRYLEHREDGLEEWLLKWCEMKEVEYRYMEEE